MSHSVGLRCLRKAAVTGFFYRSFKGRTSGSGRWLCCPKEKRWNSQPVTQVVEKSRHIEIARPGAVPALAGRKLSSCSSGLAVNCLLGPARCLFPPVSCALEGA